jgi:hypothetical protein
MDECLIFQKLTTQEKIIINALEHLNKPNDDDKSESDNDDIEDTDDD